MSCIHLKDGKCTGEASPFHGTRVMPSVCRSCPAYDGPIRGAGDVIATVTKAFRIEACGKCQQRREALNRALPAPGHRIDEEKPQGA